MTSKGASSAMRLPGRFDAWAVLGLALVAIAYTHGVIWRWALLGQGAPAHDIYAYSYPNFLYAREALHQGHGLFWNSLQNSGQPFFAIISSALLYPPNWLFLFAPDPHTVVYVHAALNLALVGVGMYLFCREAGLGRQAALCGALALELGGAALGLANWNFAMLAPFVWMPWAMFVTERALRDPSPGLGIALGGVLTLQLLAGFPQTLVFTYQLVGLRALWELATRRSWPRGRALAILAFGLALPVLLAAVQFLPALELASHSVRNAAVTLEEGNPIRWGWGPLRDHISAREPGIGTVFSVVGLALTGFALWGGAPARIAWFGLAVVTLFFGLSVVDLFIRLYREIPLLGSLFRDPSRFHWVTSLGFGLVVACGVETLVREQRLPTRRLPAALGVSIAGIAAFAWMSTRGLLRDEWVVLAATFSCLGACFLFRWGPAVARVALPVLLFANLYFIPKLPYQAHYPDDSPLREKQRMFSEVGKHLTTQERMYEFGRYHDFSIMPKSASIFGLRSISDYEPQTSRRYAEFYVRLFKPLPMRSLNHYYYLLARLPRTRPLLDLLAVRYLAVDLSPGEPADRFDIERMLPPLRLLWRDGPLNVYENSNALPRGFYVPRVEVVPDAAQLLEQLASGSTRPRHVALLEEPPADGFLGGESLEHGHVEIIEDRSEELTLRAQAPREGFVFLADQFYPGWEATVDGVATPILRANYAFRLVRVPAGESTLVFRFRPRTLRIGAGVSLLTVLSLSGYAAFAVRRRCRS